MDRKEIISFVKLIKKQARKFDIDLFIFIRGKKSLTAVV